MSIFSKKKMRSLLSANILGDLGADSPQPCLAEEEKAYV